jgi:hypothetical protein
MSETSCRRGKGDVYEAGPNTTRVRARFSRQHCVARLSPTALMGNLIIMLIGTFWRLASLGARLNACGVKLPARWRRAHPLQIASWVVAGAALGFLGSYLWLGLPPGDTILLLLLLACEPFGDGGGFMRF